MSNTRTLTAANSRIAMTVDTIFPAPVVLQGFQADNVFDMGDISPIMTTMGVDRRLSAGLVAVSQAVSLYFQGDSLSVDVFEQINQQQQANLTPYAIQLLIDCPSIQKSAICTRGFLTNLKAFNSAQRMMGGRTFTMTFERITVVPLAG